MRPQKVAAAICSRRSPATREMKSAPLLLLFLPAAAALCVPTPPVIRRANCARRLRASSPCASRPSLCRRRARAGLHGADGRARPGGGAEAARAGAAIGRVCATTRPSSSPSAPTATPSSAPSTACRSRRARAGARSPTTCNARAGAQRVAPEQRKLGIGRRLMAAAEEHARADGFSLATLEVARSNAPAIALYNRMEWDEVDEPGVPNWQSRADGDAEGVRMSSSYENR